VTNNLPFAFEVILAPGAVVGVGFGVLAAFAGRLLHQRPSAAAALGAGLAATSAVLVGVGFPLWMTELVFDMSTRPAPPGAWDFYQAVESLTIAGLALGVLVAATAIAEGLLGPRSGWGQRFAPSGWPSVGARLVATTIAAFLLAHLAGGLVTLVLGFSGPAEMYLEWAGPASLVLTALAWPVLEKGKGAYLEQLPPARRGLPEEAGPR
jgi:hypothetical protein